MRERDSNGTRKGRGEDVTLFALSDDGQLILGIIGSAFGFLTAVATGIIGVYMVKANQKAEAAAVEVEQVKVAAAASDKKVDAVADTLLRTTITASEVAEKHDAKLNDIAKTGEKTHTLVNSNMGVQLRLNAVLSRRLADMTKEPADIDAANLAEQLLSAHEGKQSIVDTKAANDRAKNSPAREKP